MQANKERPRRIRSRIKLVHKLILSHIAVALSALFVAAATSNLLGKLHFSDRTQAAVYAWREGLVQE